MISTWASVVGYGGEPGNRKCDQSHSVPYTGSSSAMGRTQNGLKRIHRSLEHAGTLLRHEWLSKRISNAGELRVLSVGSRGHTEIVFWSSRVKRVRSPALRGTQMRTVARDKGPPHKTFPFSRNHSFGSLEAPAVSLPSPLSPSPGGPPPRLTTPDSPWEHPRWALCVAGKSTHRPSAMSTVTRTPHVCPGGERASVGPEMAHQGVIGSTHHQLWPWDV